MIIQTSLSFYVDPLDRPGSALVSEGAIVEIRVDCYFRLTARLSR